MINIWVVLDCYRSTPYRLAGSADFALTINVPSLSHTKTIAQQVDVVTYYVKSQSLAGDGFRRIASLYATWYPIKLFEPIDDTA